MRILLLSLVCCVAVAVLAARPLPEGALSALNPNTFTISGISAGAAMSVQFSYAYSSIVRAGGHVAGVPYQCSGGSVAGAEMCMNDPTIAENVNTLLSYAQINADLGLIDPLSNVANQTVFIFSGLLDTVVNQANSVNIAAMYELLGVPKANMVTFFNYTAEHSWITNKYGNPCSTLGSPYINNCELDFAGKFLAFSLQRLGVKWNATMGSVNPANLFSFDQTQFGADPSTNSLATTGYMYVPAQCQGAAPAVQCHLHMNWHGCTQDAGSLSTLYVLSTELNEWAESNNIVIIYPQATANILLDNPNACMDWWYGSNFATKSGAQITAFRAMIKKFGGF